MFLLYNLYTFGNLNLKNYAKLLNHINYINKYQLYKYCSDQEYSQKFFSDSKEELVTPKLCHCGVPLHHQWAPTDACVPETSEESENKVSDSEVLDINLTIF